MDLRKIEGNFLRDIGLYKNHLMSLFLNSDDICCLMLNKNQAPSDTDSLAYTQIFPYLYVDETQTEVKSYLCFEVDIPNIPSHTIKNMEITIWAYCHKDCMKYSKQGFSGTRTDILADMVERSLRNSNEFGIGKLSLTKVSTFFPTTVHYGRQLKFLVPDFKITQ